MSTTAQAYVEGLLARGRHTFSGQEAQAALGSSGVATYHSLRRLRKKGWLAMPRRGFYLIVDPAYRELGALPPASWIDDLMRFHGSPYYVGLLTAASLHGAGHHQPHEFQVVSAMALRPLRVGRVRMRFFFRRRMEDAVTERMKTSSGYIPVSTPEMTAFDLVRYRRGAGSIDHAATVLSELAERMDAKRLLNAARKGREMPVIQRVGYLLEAVGRAELAADLARLVERARPRFVRLEPRSPEEVKEHSSRWRVLVNTTVEADA
jgi:predicted transcriptional regulator of viral defense system